MTPGDDEADDRLLERVLDLAEDERPAFLDRLQHSEPSRHAALMLRLGRLSPTDDFLERPIGRLTHLGDPPSFSAGEVLASRFRILAFVDRGGMGDIYRATDLELTTDVALKVIRPAIADDSDTIERFRNEVIRARTVSHPNACRVFDLFAHQAHDGGVVRFLTMELVEGETLAAFLERHGPMASRETLNLAFPIASAIDEAHRLGIVHRDLKPANIMLARDGTGHRPVVTDFGLAMDVANRSPSDEEPAGTTGYMAPEQARHGRVGPEVDIFALGALLREMRTGQPHPIVAPDGTTGSNHSLHLEKQWRRTIDACTDPDPARRPASATQALNMIGAVRRRTVRAIGALALALLVGMALWPQILRFAGTGSRASSGADVILSTFTNESGEPDLDVTTELIRRQLDQSAYLNVVSRESLADTLRQMVRPPLAPLTLEVAREVAWRRGAGLVVSGRIWRPERSYVLSVQLEARGAGPRVPGKNWSRNYEARDRDELRRMIGDAAGWVRATAGEAADDIPTRDRPVEQVTTRSWKALTLYTNAESLLRQARDDDALALLQEATVEDDQFALAWMRMGDILMSRRRYAEARDRWSRALELYRRLDVTPRESYRIRALYASDTGDFVEAERMYRLYLIDFPNDPTPYFYIARPLMMLGRLDDAVSMLIEAGRRDPSGYHVPAQLAMLYLRAGRVADAAVPIARLRELRREDWADCVQGAADFMSGNAASALARFEALHKVTDKLLKDRSLSLQAAVLAEQGRYREAADRLQIGIDADAAQGGRVAEADRLLALSSLWLRLGQRRATRDAVLRAEQLDPSPARLIRGGGLLARAGYPDEAEQVLRRLATADETAYVRIGLHRLRGEILLARGRTKDGWSEIRRAASLEPAGAMPEYYARAAEASGEVGIALALYERMANTPGYFWRYPDSELPGSWADALGNYLRLARTHAPGADTSAAARAYAALGRRLSPVVH